VGATSWTEQSQSAGTSWYEGLPGRGISDGFALFGMPIPLYNASPVADATSPFTEMSQSATAMTEMSQSATTWTEFTG